MKLRHALAGTVALPLALAVASSANAATVVDNDEHKLQIGGFVAAQSYWATPDEGDMNYGMDLGTSRLNVMYTDANDVTYYYEQNIANNSLRHAAILYDGMAIGQTWSFFANLNGLGETLDANGNAITSTWASRNPLIGKNISLGDGMSVGVSIEERGLNDGNAGGNSSPLPDLTANFKGDFNGIGIFAAAQMYQTNDATDAEASEGKTRMTASAAVPVGDALTAKGSFTTDPDKYTAMSASVQFKMSDQLRTNLVAEQYASDVEGEDAHDYTQLWVNAIYTTASGVEWGGEIHTVMGDEQASVTLPAGGAASADGDMTFRVQAKYAF